MNLFFFISCILFMPLALGQTYAVNQDMGRVEAGALRYKIEAPGETVEGWSEQKAPQIVYLEAGTRVSLAIDLQVTETGPVYFEYPSMMEHGRWFEAQLNGPAGAMPLTLLQGTKPLWQAKLTSGTYHFVFQHITPAGAVPLKLHLRDATEMATGYVRDGQIFSLIYGIGLAYIVFNLAMFVFFREIYFIYYVGYSVTLLFALAAASGHVPAFKSWLWFGAILANVWFACLMSDSILSLREKLPRIRRAIFWIISLATVVHYAVVFLNLHPFPLRYSFPIAMIAVGLCVYSAVVRMMAGYTPAAFFAAGWTILIFGYGLNFLGIAVPKLIYLSWASYTAYATESLFFAIALAYRTRDTERTMEKERVHALNQLQKIVYPHQIESIKRGSTLEQTMPTGAGRACVIAFDIVGSSRIQHVRAPDFFHNVFRRCYEAMMEGYDGSDMRAQAFRIKEMGDGFLCSVGYPFRSLTENPANDAYRLALTFARILQEESPILQMDEPVRCGIGIALDSLSGFYPDSGTKEYDLYGQAIILATRYESMRKNLFEGELPASVLILQERVYRSLDRDLRAGFEEVAGITVRDDPAATRLYTQFLKPTLAVAA